tara:strand:+ start:320 stop:745 length:426 start_codon:yes stop_codon:yes gene_type:complete
MKLWVYYGIMVSILYAGWILIEEYYIKNGYDIIEMVLLSIILAGVLAGFLFYNADRPTFYKIRDSKYWVGIVTIAVFIIITNIVYAQALKKSNNSGYVAALSETHIALVAIGAYILYKSKFSSYGIIGMVMILIGAIFLCI